MPNELKPLRLASGKRVQGLPQPEVTEPNLRQDLQRLRQRMLFPDLFKEIDRLRHSELKHIMDGVALEPNPQNVRLETAPFAFGAAHVEIAQELHFDFFKAGPAAAFAA